MDPRDQYALDGIPLPEGLTELPPEAAEGYDPGKFRIERTDPEAQARHADCRMFALDLDHDPDAKAAARYYAARVTARRPVLAQDLHQIVGEELRPGEEYVPAPPALPWEGQG